MVRDILIGLSVGMVAGAFIVKNSKPCEDAVCAVTDAVGDHMKQMKKGKTQKKSKPKAQAKTEA